MIKNVVSDLGGCLFFCDFKKVTEGLAKQSWLNGARIYKEMDWGNDYKDYEKGLINSETFYKKIKEKINFKNSFETFKKIWIEEIIFSVNKEYAKLCLAFLKKGYKIYCLSNINELHWKKISEDFFEMELFHGCFLSFQMKKTKPSPEIYEEVITKIKSRPNEFLFIDDRKENVEGAKKAGMRALLYNYKKHAEFTKKISKLLEKNNLTE